jgi:hypothetical protein
MEVGCFVQVAEADADREIVTAALENSQVSNSVVVGQDTDILILLLALAKSQVFMLMLGSQRVPERIFDILKLQNELGVMKSFLLFIHAFTGSQHLQYSLTLVFCSDNFFKICTLGKTKRQIQFLSE